MTRRSLSPSRSLAPDEAWGVPAVFSRDGTHAGDRPDGCPRLLQAAGFEPEEAVSLNSFQPPGLPLKALSVSRRCPYHFISDRAASSSRFSAARPRGRSRRARSFSFALGKIAVKSRQLEE